MGSKKHKKESKKKRHRSRSPLGVEKEHKERKRHKKHRKRKHSPEVEEVPVDSHLQQNGDNHRLEEKRSASDNHRHEEKRSASDNHRHEEKRTASDNHRHEEKRTASDNHRHEEKRSASDNHRHEEKRSASDNHRHEEKRTASDNHRHEEKRTASDNHRHEERRSADDNHRHEERRSTSVDYSDRRRDIVADSPTPEPSTSNAESLSIAETNKLRAKLGLKPLEVVERHADDGKIKDDLGEFYHKPATNITQQKKTAKIKEKLQERREKRKMEQKLKTSLLGDGSDDDNDPSAWVMKSRDIEKQRKVAAKRAAMLDEMDEVFGVSALVAEEVRVDRDKSYTAKQLKGLRVGHDIDTLTEERDVVLTLADKNVLDDDNEDVLVNVNIVDNEKYKKKVEDTRKAKAGYQAYDNEEDVEAAALGYTKPVLAKYDEDINEGKPDRGRGFIIGDDDALEATRHRQMMIRERLANTVEKRLESLVLPDLQVASDYFNEQEINAKFKKPKKKGKIRKKAKQEPIDVDSYDPSNTPLETDDTDVKPGHFRPEFVEEDEIEPDSELQVALARARRLRQAEQILLKVPKVEEILETVKKEEEPLTSDTPTSMILDATAEFCRTLGDIPTYGQSGNRDSKVEIMDLDLNEPDIVETDETSGAWSRVDVNADKPADIVARSSGALEAEPALGSGLAGALKLAFSKGYLEREIKTPAPSKPHNHLLTARHYSIEDKTYGEDDKHGRRERGHHSGPLQDFREKAYFRPAVKLDYVDDDGRPLCPKEAFRYLSHKFHGKGPGKNKQEKRIKKAVQEGLMKKMSSTDTPLNTLQMLQDKQKETQSPYIVLSGARRDQPQ